MSIAASMERTIKQMETSWQRQNGDFDQQFLNFIDDLRADTDRVHGLEWAASLDTRAVAQTGEGHEHRA